MQFMEVLLDTKVLLDRALNRDGGPDALKVIQFSLVRGDGLWIAWHTLSNMDYILHRAGLDRTAREQELRLVIQQCRIAPTTELEAMAALNLGFNDFEDALQATAAQCCGASWIVTNNTTDFTSSPVPAVKAADFLARFP